MASGGGDRVSRPALLAGIVLAGLFTVLFYSYNFSRAPLFMELAPAKNPHFAIIALFLDNLASLFDGAAAAFGSLLLRLETLGYLLGAAAISFAALSFGLLVLDLLGAGRLPRAEKGPLAFALGLGVFSLATLGLGLAGLLTWKVFVPLVIAVCAAGAKRGAKFLWKLRERGRPWTAADKTFVALAALGAVITVAYALVPPMEFDALEYHVGAPAYYLAKGRISYVEYNVYSNFPANSEMLYLMSMVLTCSKLSGAVLGNILNACVAIAACVAVYALGVFLSGARAGAFAAAALITSMGFFAVATGVYVEPLQILYTVLAVLAVSRFVKGGSRGALVAGAIATGLAMGVKYPSAVFVAVPLAAVTLLVRGSVGARIKAFVTFGIIAMLVVSPWLVKNWVLTGNPVYPLLYKVFDGRDWSPLQDARWTFAHTPKGAFAFEQWARHVFALFFSKLDISLLSFVFIPLAFAARPMPKRLFFILAFGLLYVFLWFALTHRIERFAVPAFAVLAAVSGAGLAAVPEGSVRRLATAFAALLIFVNTCLIGLCYGQIVDLSVPLTGKYDAFLTANVASYPALTKVNQIIAPSSKVLLVAEAETFYLDVDYASATVFDRKQFDEIVDKAAGDPAAVGKALKDAGFSFIFVNWFTFNRQQDTYTFQYGGKSVPGYSAVVSPALFDSLEKAGTIRRIYASGPEIEPLKVPSYALYSVE